MTWDGNRVGKPSRFASDSAALGTSGPELDAMAFAQNYYRWIMNFFRPFLHGTVLEVGAGIGNFSTHLAAAGPDRLVLVEPGDELYKRLADRFAASSTVEAFHGDLRAWATQQGQRHVDVIVSVNVLEHIQDDDAVVRIMSSVVRPGGAILLLVPALPFLYGSMDVAFGHWRRYSKDALVHLLTEAGLSIRTVRYMNMLGALAWFTTGRVLRRRSVSPFMVRVSDSVMIHVGRLLEARMRVPFGQSLVAIAERST